MIALFAMVGTSRVAAQTDYRNTDAGRPIRIEDATATDRYGLELELPTVRAERLTDGSATLRVEPLLSYGLLPRTEIDVRLPYVERGPNLSPRGGIAGLGVTLLHNLNNERGWLPAFAVSGSALLPVGALVTGPTTYAVKGILTRNLPFVRVNANVLYGTYYVPPDLTPPLPDCPLGSIAPGCGGTGGGPSPPRFPDGPCSAGSADVAARCMQSFAMQLAVGTKTGAHWLAGVSLDHAFPLKSLLILGDVYAEQFTKLGRPADWTVELGLRKQATPRTVIDAGIGRRFTSLNKAWVGTVAMTVAFGVRPLVPLRANPARHRLMRFYHQTYLPQDDNWKFHRTYASADHLFNAFDYGHAILSERLLTEDGTATSLESREFDHVVRDVLRHPPSVPLDETAIAPEFARLVPEVIEVFEWAHMLHRQIYDALVNAHLSEQQKDERVRTLVRYYRSRSDLAFSPLPIGMQLMNGQPYSGVFRAKAPKYNGLIWSYHWLQMHLYDSLLKNSNRAARDRAVAGDLQTFFDMLKDAPASMPHDMPMSADVAPEFAHRYPDATNIFDNLHSFHDVVSDILADPHVERSRKRAEILHASEMFRAGKPRVE
jgi:hypothetical protein